MKLNFYKSPHLIIPAFGSLALLSLEFPIWFFLMATAGLLWRYLGEKEKLALPKPWMTNSFSVVLLICVLTVYKTLFDSEASSLFFSGLCVLKILEYKTKRDHQFIVLLLMLLIPSKFLFSIDVWILPITAWMSYHLWLAMISFRFPQRKLPKPFRTYFLKAALVSVPLTFALYFIFPRVNSFLMKSNLSTGGNAVSGFGNEIHPGSISQLAQSQELIFRAEITTSIEVDRHQLYWRGLMLRSTDGFRWVQGPPSPDKVIAGKDERLVEYKITMEPSQQRWLFPLDRPLLMSGPVPMLKMRDGTFQTSSSFETRTVLRAHSDLSLKLSSENPENFLKIPTPSDRVQELVKKFRDKTTSRDQIVKNIKSYFIDKNFSYTLTPGEMDDRSVDDFLFRARKGYCEHFASSFAILARVAGIPARVVIGYQGGDFNTLGNFYTVRAQDAHAWNEYLNDQGEWTRFDLVDFVAPVRTELGTAEYLKLPEGLRGFNVSRKGLDELFIFVAYDYLTTYAESLNFYWTQWLLDFNLDKQTEILDRLPFSFSMILLTIVGIIFFIFLVFRFWNFWTDRKNIIQFFYKRVLKWALRHGIPKEAWEGPTSFAARLKLAWPNHAKDFDLILQNYVDFTYGERPVSTESLKQMTNSLLRIESLSRFH